MTLRCNSFLATQIITLCFAATALAAEEKQVLPPDVAQALASNASELSPIDVSFSYRSQTPLSPEQAEKLMPLQDIYSSLTIKRDQRVIWQDGHIYNWENDLQMGREQETTWNGSVFYGGSIPHLPDGSRQDVLSKELPSELVKKSRPQANYFNLEFFDAIGWPLPTHLNELAEKNQAHSIILDLLQQGGTLQSVHPFNQGQESLLLIKIEAENLLRKESTNPELGKVAAQSKDKEKLEKLQPYFEARKQPAQWVYFFYLDPQKHYAIRKFETHYEDGSLLTRNVCDDFEHLANRQVWFPHKCVAETFNMPSQVMQTPVITRTFIVSGIKLDRVPESQFVLNYTTPGTTFIDRTVTPNRTTHIPEQQ